MFRLVLKSFQQLFAMHRFNRQYFVFGLCLVGLGSFSGCGSGNDASATVQGTVTLDGELARSGSVVFHPAGDFPAAYGTISTDGTFVLRVGRGNVRNADHSVIHPGEYVATVTIRGPSTPDEEFEGAPPIAGPLLTAARYSKKATSGLDFSVKAGLNVVNLEVESPSEEELQAIREAAETKVAEAEAAEKETGTEAGETAEETSEAERQPSDEQETATEEDSNS